MAAWLLILSLAACAPATPQLQPITPEQWPLKRAKLNDAPLVVYLWATWCRECVDMLPAVIEQGLANRDRGLRIATVCLDDPDDPAGAAEARRLIAAYPPTVSHFLLRTDLARSLALLDIHAIPAVLVYTASGELAHRLQPIDEEQPLAIADVADAIDTVLPPPAAGS